MKRHFSKGLEWLEFDLLADLGIKHGVLCRSCDLTVPENISKIQNILNLSTIHHLKQVHGTHVVAIHEDSPPHCGEGDAMVCAVADKTLLVKHGDCQAAIFYDPIKHIMSVVHSGWRGSVQNIFSTTIDRLKQLGSDPANLLVCISPSLGPCHAEFTNYRTELPESFWEYQTKPNFFDFWAISTAQLKAEGILEHHIEIARQCTYANATDFYSYRRDKDTGRNGTFINC